MPTIIIVTKKIETVLNFVVIFSDLNVRSAWESVFMYSMVEAEEKTYMPKEILVLSNQNINCTSSILIRKGLRDLRFCKIRFNTRVISNRFTNTIF